MVGVRFFTAFVSSVYELSNQHEELRNRPLKGVSRRHSCARGHLFQQDIRLSRAVRRDRQVRPHLHARHKILILYPKGSPHPDPPPHSSLLFHLPDTRFEPSGLRGIPSRALRAPHDDAGPVREPRLRLAEGLKETVKIPRFPVLVNPADRPGVHPLVEFFLRKIRNPLPGFSQSLFLCIGIISRKPQDHLALRRQAAPQGLRRLLICQPPVNQADGSFQITTELPAENILRKPHGKPAEIFVDIIVQRQFLPHTLSGGRRFCRPQGFTVSGRRRHRNTCNSAPIPRPQKLPMAAPSTPISTPMPAKDAS